MWRGDVGSCRDPKSPIKMRFESSPHSTLKVEEMKSCKGRKYLVEMEFSDLCSGNDGYARYETNPYTGSKHRVLTGFRPTVQEMRSEKGLCGPEARLYSPTFVRRIALYLKEKYLNR